LYKINNDNDDDEDGHDDVTIELDCNNKIYLPFYLENDATDLEGKYEEEAIQDWVDWVYCQQ
jgi:hypothetical protein